MNKPGKGLGRWLPGTALVACLAVVPVRASDPLPATNLMVNPGAEESVSPADYPEKQSMWVKAEGRLPLGWGSYLGAGKGFWGVTDKEARTGKHSVFLAFKDWHTNKENGERNASLSLSLGMGNGYTGVHAIEARPDTTYAFSFWLKGRVSFVAIRPVGWSDPADSGQRQYLPVKRLRRNGMGVRRGGRSTRVMPTDEWVQVSGQFTTLPDTKRLAVTVGLVNPILLAPGQAIFLDDAVVHEVGRP